MKRYIEQLHELNLILEKLRIVYSDPEIDKFKKRAFGFCLLDCLVAITYCEKQIQDLNGQNPFGG